MSKISHYINKEGKVVIEATIDNNTYVAIIEPSVIDNRIWIPASAIDTREMDNPQNVKETIISHISTQRGKNKESPLLIDKNK